MTEISLQGVTVFLSSARQKVNHHLVGAFGRAGGPELSRAGYSHNREILLGFCIFMGILGAFFIGNIRFIMGK